MTQALQTDWPSEPYKGLAHYGPDDRPLFTGRDEDVDVCIHFLAAPETRILLLHGQTGCGKSSFLRAGLIPSLEERAFGYLFLRDAAGAPVFIRCGPDPIGRIAEHLFRFSSQPVRIDTARGERVYDVSEACLGCKDVKDYIEACRKPGMLIHSLLALAKVLPCTLVIILDQAEEVITLSEGKSDYRRQFFRFVREFSTTNFPLKFVLALRKDNSGEFIGLAQMGGSLELPPLPSDTGTLQVAPAPANGSAVARDTPSGSSEGHARPVKSDIKLFLLSELTREEVLHAILQPTLKTPVEGRTPPFDTYQFDYADGVAREIVDDIFNATSSTAVLPVMQIVCRDLYNRVATEDPAPAVAAAPRRKRPRPWHIDHKLYETGGGIQGPVDRHVSRSLISSFGSMVPEGEVKAEERRWRDILFRLVRRESDGTVHTNIVSLAQLRAMADEIRPIAKVDPVVEYLTRPEVLLLRSVTILSADDPDEGRLVSLGHDFIGMVLQQWKVRQLEAEAAHRRVLRVAKIAGATTFASALVLATVIYVGYRASEHGKAQQKQNVLLNAATFTQRDDPMFAMLAAAHASRVADELSHDRLQFGEKARDTKADELLARMLAGFPKTTNFSSAAPTPPGPFADADRNIALPKAGGYVMVDAARAEIITEVTGQPRRARFDLDPMPTVQRSNVPVQTQIAIDEPKAGTVLLMRIQSPSQFQDVGSSSHQLFVFTSEGKAGPFDAEYFTNFAENDSGQRSAPPRKTPSKRSAPANPLDDAARFSREGITWLDLSGGVVVLSRFTLPQAIGSKGALTVDSFVFDERKKPSPFRRGFVKTHIEFDPNQAQGIVTPVFVDGYLLTPQARAGSKGADAQSRIVRYDLRRPAYSDGQAVELDELTQLLRCAPEVQCQWQLFPRREPGTLVVFGALRSSVQLGQRSIDQISQADIDNFERFVVADVATGRAISLDADDLRKRLGECAAPRADAIAGGASPSKTPSKLFVSGTVDSLVVGFPAAHAVDVLRIAGSRGAKAAQCIGTLMVPADTNEWSVSADGATLLGVGAKSGAMWDMKESVDDRARRLQAGGKLTDRACAAGLRDYQPSKERWMVTTYLDPEAPVCGVIMSTAAEGAPGGARP